MSPWSMLSGSPRLGEVLPAHRLGRAKGSVRDRVRATRLSAILLGAVTLVALADALDLALALPEAAPLVGDATGADRAARLLVALTLPAALLVALAGAARAVTSRHASRPQRSALAHVSFGLATFALGAALAALAGPGASLEPAAAYFPSRLTGAPLATGALLLATPLVAGLHAHGVALALGIGGTAPRVAPLHRAWGARASRDLTESRAGGALRGLAALPRHWGVGFAAPGLVLCDLLVTVAARVGARVTGQVVDRVHLDADLRTLAEALSARGLSVEDHGRVLLVTLSRPAPTEVTVEPEEAGFRRVVRAVAGTLGGAVGEAKQERVRLRAGVLYLPPVESANVLNLRGPPRAVRRLRRLLETELLFVGTFAWSLEARRIERRLNAIAAEAAYAGTIEERSVLLEEATHLERVAHGRALIEEEWTLLAAWKAVRLRAILQDRILTAPSDARREGRLVAPGATLPPDVEKLVAAGGLAAVRSIVYVPYFVVPVQVAWGEPEFVVNAATGRIDRAESRALLDAMRARGTRFFVDGSRVTQFARRPVAGGAAYGEVRRVLRHELGYWGPLQVDEALVETVYVPYVEADGKLVNAVTGKESRDVRAALADMVKVPPA